LSGGAPSSPGQQRYARTEPALGPANCGARIAPAPLAVAVRRHAPQLQAGEWRVADLAVVH